MFVPRMLQGRNPKCVAHFFAAYDGKATWFDELRPAFEEGRFFFEEEPDQFEERGLSPSLP